MTFEPPLLVRNFHFDLIDQTGRKYTVADVRAVTIEEAVEAARKYCRNFSLPGWRLEHDGVSYPAVMFKEDRGPPGKPRLRKRRLWR